MKALLLPLVLLLALTPAASATIDMTLKDTTGNYTPSQQLSGTAEARFNEFIPQESLLSAYINEGYASSLSLDGYVQAPSHYTFADKVFDYDIMAEGTNTYSLFPEEAFGYEVTAAGTCGGDYCYVPGGADTCDCPLDCGPPYPCAWSAKFSSSGSVNGKEGLKEVYNASLSITIPRHGNEDTSWGATSDNPKTTVAMQQACGGQFYSTHKVGDDGWVRRTIQKSELLDVPGTSDKDAYIERFRHDSLYQSTQYNGGPGGIYKDSIYQVFGSGAEWNGTEGYIKLQNYNANSYYYITYLPPEGPMVCAFTDSSQTVNQEWEESRTIEGNLVDYANPYSRTYSLQELESLVPPPDCPVGSEDCQKSTSSYEAFESRDPSGTVTVSWDPLVMAVSATTASRDLMQEYSFTVPLSAFTGLKAPSGQGDHTLLLSITFQGQTLSSASGGFSTCADADRDLGS